MVVALQNIRMIAKLQLIGHTGQELIELIIQVHVLEERGKKGLEIFYYLRSSKH